MRIKLNATSRRGSTPVAGDVYRAKHKSSHYKVVLHVIRRQGDSFHQKPWNNVIMLALSERGEVRNVSAEPELYVQGHMDLIGSVVGEMPRLEFEI